MKFDAFIGGSYQSQALTADIEQTINWYAESLQSPGATAKTALYPTPGVVSLSQAGSGNGRAHLSINGREFAVIGTTLLEVLRNGSTTTLGSVAPGDYPATINSNGDLGEQLFVTSGGNAYVYDLTTKTLTTIASLVGRATMGAYLDGYFIALDANTSTIYISALADGLTWTTGTDYAQRSLAPDKWKAIKVVGRYIWLFGETTTEIWQDTGAQTFPLAPFPGTLFEYGIAAPFSAAVVGHEIVWLGRNKAGKLCVLRGSSPPAVISHYPLESALVTYPDIEHAVGDSYADLGHTFYLLNVERAAVTWAWDEATGLWAERGTWRSDLNRFTSWRPRFYAYAYGQHRMLDSSSGQIYRMGSDLLTDVDGLPIRRVRRAPAIVDENKRVFYSSFELDLEPGLGTRGDFAFFSMAAVTMTVSWVVVETEAGIAPDSFDYTFTPTIVGGTGPFTYSWDFGDGEAPDTNEIPTQVWARNGWPNPATISVTLTVTDSLGAVATYTQDVVVTFNT
jgi:hypothetical protein